MKTIHINSTKINDTFNFLTQTLGGDYSKNLREHILKIDSEMAYGSIRGMQLNGGISFLQFDLTFNEDVQLIFKLPIKKYLNFAYCSEGKLAHRFNENDKRVELETFQTGILTNITQEQNIIYFEKDTLVTASFINVDVSLDSNKGNYIINHQLKEQFVNNYNNDVIIVGSHNLKIAERIKQLQAVRQEGVVRTLLIEGLVNVILALEIEQHKLDLEHKENPTGNLTRDEMSKVKDLSEFINNFPETNLTVIELAQKIGLSPSKIQEGFKLMHNTTVNDYIRDVRVTKSEELIKTTDMNISEILYTLGFSSRSYFSKIFKAKYNCSPNQYKIQNRLAVSA